MTTPATSFGQIIFLMYIKCQHFKYILVFHLCTLYPLLIHLLEVDRKLCLVTKITTSHLDILDTLFPLLSPAYLCLSYFSHRHLLSYFNFQPYFSVVKVKAVKGSLPQVLL